MFSYKKVIKSLISKLFGLEIRRVSPKPENQFDKRIFKSQKGWDYLPAGYWIGGRFLVTNFSQGYHGILQQWWEYYSKDGVCLLISENNKVKSEFQAHYPNWRFTTLDRYDNLGEPVDVTADICSVLPVVLDSSFDLVICQATLEHVYAPFNAMQNMVRTLKVGGVLLIHTHLPNFYYHPYPRDYLRFHPDWFEDIPSFINNVELLELYTVGGHVFAAYRKLTN